MLVQWLIFGAIVFIGCTWALAWATGGEGIDQERATLRKIQEDVAAIRNQLERNRLS